MAGNATYNEENFEEYYRSLVEEYCRVSGVAFRLDQWDGARENMRDDAFDEDGNPEYDNEELIYEYLYFCIYEDLDAYVQASPFAGRNLAPVHDDQEMTYEMFVYREGDKPYSHYDTGRMDLYRGSYTFDEATCSFHFQEPTKVVFDV